jgi:hypothetical protein
MRFLIGPVLITLLSIPLFMKKVPRNPLYGLRTEYSMSSDDAWYSSNKVAGLGGIVGGVLWLLAALLLPIFGLQPLYSTLIGVGLLIAGVAIAVNVMS